jgi:Domain of unknown function (DUF5668)
MTRMGCHMTGRHYDRRGAGIFSGLLFLSLGVILLAGNLNFFPLRTTLSYWWPVLLIIIGVKHFFVFRGPQALGGGLFWIGTGVLFLSSTLGLFNIGISRLLWPVMIIWFGVFIVLGHACEYEKPVDNGSES